MKIYFSCSITGGRQDQAIYKKIVDFLIVNGQDVLTHHLSEPNLTDLDITVNPETVYRRDFMWLTDCQALVAEVSTPSHGVGYEIAIALSMHKPVFCCARQDVRVSKMLEGNNSHNFFFYRYTDQGDLEQRLLEFVNQSARLVPDQ